MLTSARGKTLDWRWDLAIFPLAEERLTALQSQGIELAFSNIPMNNDNLARLDPIRPVFISCQLTQSPFIGTCSPNASMLPATPCWRKPAT